MGKLAVRYWSVRARENSNDKRQQVKGRKTEYFLGNGMKFKIPSEIKPPLVDLPCFHKIKSK